MRKFVSCLIALCLMLTPVMSLADSDVSSYAWVSDVQFDMYDLGFSIVMPEGWTRADDETLAKMNEDILNTSNAMIDGADAAATDPAATEAAATDAAATDATAANTALYPYVIAMMTNADESVKLVITCEELESELQIDTADKYIELFANDIVASGAAEGVTYTYDMSTVADATLSTQTFRELAVVGSDGSLIDLLVCFSGMGSFYTIAINGTQDSISTFATEFVNSIQEIEAVG